MLCQVVNAQTTVTANPSSDDAVSGTWTGVAGTRYALVNDYPDATGLTFLTNGTTAGYLTFGYSAFALPSNATSISVSVNYYDQKTAAQSTAIGARLKVNGVYYNATTHNPANGTWTLRTDTWATNPNTGVAWVYSDINTLLTAFGWLSTDASPTINLSSIQLSVTYTVSATSRITIIE